MRFDENADLDTSNIDDLRGSGGGGNGNYRNDRNDRNDRNNDRGGKFKKKRF